MLKDYKIIHLAFDFGGGGSIPKIINDIIKHVPLTHYVFSLKECQRDDKTYYGDYDEFVKIVNKIKPHIIHLHINSQINFKLEDFNYTPKVIQTLHGSEKSNFVNHCDEVVCIHNCALSFNSGASVIYNGIDVDYKVDPDSLKHNNPIFTGRTTTERLNEDTAKVLSDCTIDGNKTDIVGYYGICMYAKLFSQYVNAHSNLNLVDWQKDMRKTYTNAMFLLVWYPECKMAHNKLPYGLNVLEAVGCGLPVVAHVREQSNQQLIINGVTGYVCQNEQELIDKARLLQNDTDLLKEMASNTLQYISPTISAKNMANAYFDKYMAMMDKL